MLSHHRGVRRGWRDDDGQLTVLILGYVAIALLLVLVGLEASTAFLAQRALSAAADDAAIAAAGGVNTQAIYARGISCGRPLPIDPDKAQTLADESVAGDGGLRRAFASVRTPTTSVQNGTVRVTLSGQAKLPFGAFIGLIDTSLRNGRVDITVHSFASSPVVAAGGCR